MRLRLFQALLGCTVRATRPRTIHVANGLCAAPPKVTFIPPVAIAPLSPFVRGAHAHVQPLVVRAAILSQARCLHLTPSLCKKHHKRRGGKKIDDCSGYTKRRRTGFNKSCPPPPRRCPPQHKDHEECPHGFGGKGKSHKHHKHH